MLFFKIHIYILKKIHLFSKYIMSVTIFDFLAEFGYTCSYSDFRLYISLLYLNINSHFTERNWKSLYRKYKNRNLTSEIVSLEKYKFNEISKINIINIIKKSDLNSNFGLENKIYSIL